MKARKLQLRSENPIRFESSGNYEKYYAYCNAPVLNGFVLIKEGTIQAGDYCQDGQEQISERKWIRAIGYCGMPISKVINVCRPKNKLDIAQESL